MYKCTFAYEYHARPERRVVGSQAHKDSLRTCLLETSAGLLSANFCGRFGGGLHTIQQGAYVLVQLEAAVVVATPFLRASAYVCAVRLMKLESGETES
jgi:hypothetical protein